MIFLIVALKLFILAFLLSIFLASYFHTRESQHMEKRLGIALPGTLKLFMNTHIIATLSALVIVSFLFVF